MSTLKRGLSVPTVAHEYGGGSKERAKCNAARFAEKYGLGLVVVILVNHVVVRGDEWR